MNFAKFLLTPFLRNTSGTIGTNPAGSYVFKVNIRNTRTKCEICSKLPIKIPERRQRQGQSIIVGNEKNSLFRH